MRRLYELIDKVWQWIAEIAFLRFEFDLPTELLREKNAGKDRVIYAVTRAGLLEWLILSSWCRRHGLGAILVSNRLWVLLFSKPKYFFQILFRTRTYADLFLDPAEEGPRLLFCPVSERKKVFVPTSVERLLGDLAAATAAGDRLSFTLVPVFILWRKYVRGASRSLGEYLWGLSSSPNLIGKVWYLLRRRRDSMVRAVSHFPFLAREAGEGAEGLDEGEPLRIAKATRRKILVAVHQEMRVSLGPRYHSPHSVKETLLKDPDIQQLVTEIAEREGVDRRKILTRAYRNLNEIAANYTFRFVEVMYVLLTWLFNKVFDGVVVSDHELQKVRETLKSRPVVFIPCHRSHFDYLVIPYLVFLHDMMTPHIAAGINLAFWPVGYFLRKGGAFFIRRSFRGDALYSLCLKKYVEHLLKNRYNVMFFIEGTRSRSGKMLAPAYGMLKMVFETVQRKQCEDIALVPVSLSYDEVPEQGSYTRELAGGTKVKESARELLKSHDIVRRKFGKVYVRLAAPVSTRSLTQAASDSGIDDTLMLQKSAFQICKSINDITPITAKSLVSSVFLAHGVSSLPYDEVLRLVRELAGYVAFTGLALSPMEEGAFHRAVEQTVRQLQNDGILNISSGVPRTFFCENRKRRLLNFYKNNSIHCLVIPSILFLAYFDTLKASDLPAGELRQTILSTALKLRNLLKFEFFFSPTPLFLEELERAMAYFFGSSAQGTAVEMTSALALRYPSWDDVSVYLRLLGDLIESYLTVIQFIKENNKGYIDKKALVQRIVDYAEQRGERGGVVFPESVSVQNYSNALLLLENLKAVSTSKEGEKTMVRLSPDNPGLEALRVEFSYFLDLMQERPAHIARPGERLALENAIPEERVE